MTGGERLRHVPVNSEGAGLFRTFTTGKAGRRCVGLYAQGWSSVVQESSRKRVRVLLEVYLDDPRGQRTRAEWLTRLFDFRATTAARRWRLRRPPSGRPVHLPEKDIWVVCTKSHAEMKEDLVLTSQVL